jgi:hypothetical protein
VQRHCLVGEGFEQIDLRVGESTGLSTTYQYDADGIVLAHHRYGQDAAKSDRAAHLRSVVLPIQLDVRYVDDGAFEDRPIGGIIEGPQRTVHGVAQVGGAVDDGIEDGCTLVGELLITRRISLVAVCCSSDSLT